MEMRNIRQGEYVLVLVEPESSSLLTGFRNKRMICHGNALEFVELQAVCISLRRVKCRLTVRPHNHENNVRHKDREREHLEQEKPYNAASLTVHTLS